DRVLLFLEPQHAVDERFEAKVGAHFTLHMSSIPAASPTTRPSTRSAVMGSFMPPSLGGLPMPCFDAAGRDSDGLDCRKLDCRRDACRGQPGCDGWHMDSQRNAALGQIAGAKPDANRAGDYGRLPSCQD